MNKLFFSILLSLSISIGFAQHMHHTFETPEGKRSDTLNVLHYDIALDLTDSIGKELFGEVEIKLVSKLNGLTKVNLDLQQLTVDSLWLEGNKTTNWTHSNNLLSITTPPKNVGDTIRIKAAYHGLPFGERWGGWYNNSTYIFNLGVGFESIPHNLGKVWHPCVDNFIERATYTVKLKTYGNWIGVGSGVLVSVDTIQQNPRILNRTWQLDQEIPTYLYGIAAARYVLLKDTLKGPLTTVPSDLYVLPSQVSSMQTKTQRLEDCFKLYENVYGKYRWDRVGYSTTSQGAMEHATNIAIPPSASESTIMHELSHHWWGDLITCESDRDMWINEGMAVFSEYVFTEESYGSEQARNDMRNDLFTVLNTAHISEDGYQPISGVPRVHTYGTHTYRKGALVGHNLRVKLGDQKTWSGFKAFLDANAFSAVNSYDLQDGLQSATGVDLTDFFDDWVFGSGMACYTVDTFKIEPTAGLYKVNLSVRQLKANSNHFYGEMPLEVLFMDANRNEHKATIKVAGELTKVELKIPINATYATLNPDYNLNYAMTATDNLIGATGAVNSQNLVVSIQASSVTDTAFVRAQTYWTGPSISLRNAVDLGARINNNRYWRIDGVGAASFTISGAYNAQKNNRDYGLVKSSEDSLIVLYRRNAAEPWTIHSNYSITVGLPADSLGGFRIENAGFGEYVLAEYDSSFNEGLFASTTTYQLEPVDQLKVFPNPTNNKVSIEVADFNQNELVVLNTLGELVLEQAINQEKTELNFAKWESGVYFVLLYKNGVDKPIDYKRLIKK